MLLFDPGHRQVEATKPGVAYPKAVLDEAWKTLLLCQFHDVLPGTSIPAVHHETVDMLTKARQAVAGSINKALQTLGEYLIGHASGSSSTAAAADGAASRNNAGAVLPVGSPVTVDATGATLLLNPTGHARDELVEVRRRGCGE